VCISACDFIRIGACHATGKAVWICEASDEKEVMGLEKRHLSMEFISLKQ